MCDVDLLFSETEVSQGTTILSCSLTRKSRARVVSAWNRLRWGKNTSLDIGLTTGVSVRIDRVSDVDAHVMRRDIIERAPGTEDDRISGAHQQIQATEQVG